MAEKLWPAPTTCVRQGSENKKGMLHKNAVLLLNVSLNLCSLWDPFTGADGSKKEEEERMLCIYIRGNIL